MRSCDICQRLGQPTSASHMPHQAVLPLEPFQKWGLDFIGPFKPAASQTGSRYILTATDYSTKWAEAWALRDNTAVVVARMLYKDIFSQFGCPIEIVSDWGGHFLNN